MKETDIYPVPTVWNNCMYSLRVRKGLVFTKVLRHGPFTTGIYNTARFSIFGENITNIQVGTETLNENYKRGWGAPGIPS